MKIASVLSKFSFQDVKPGLLLCLGVALTACDGGAIVGSNNEEPRIQLPIVAGESGGSTQGLEQSTATLSSTELAANDPAETNTDSESAVSNGTPESTNEATTNPTLTQSITEILSDAEKSNGLRIMAVGDSITQGTSGLSSYRSEFFQLMNESGCAFKMVGTQSATLHSTDFYQPHESYSGATAEHFILGHQNNKGISFSTDHQKPDVILLHLGSVDIFTGQSVASTIAELDQVVATIYDTKPDTLVLLANLIPTFDESNGIDQTLAELSTGIEQLAHESNYSLLSLVDVRSGYTADMMQSDLTLPNEEGEAHIADAFHAKLMSYDICK